MLWYFASWVNSESCILYVLLIPLHVTAAPTVDPAKATIGPTLSLRPLAPANPVGVVCTGCHKVLLKGQTAFQRKGCPKLYCSPQCLCSTSTMVVKIPQKKQCYHCLKYAYIKTFRFTFLNLHYIWCLCFCI